jgi:hypothetical protein
LGNLVIAGTSGDHHDVIYLFDPRSRAGCRVGIANQFKLTTYFDAIDRLIADTNQFDKSRTHSYDNVGNPIQTIDIAYCASYLFIVVVSTANKDNLLISDHI